MSKKLICLFLSIVLLLGVLAGCAEKSDEDAAADKSEAASEAARTLSMYLMSEEPVSAETAAMIEEAVNQITEKKFKTRMKLYYYTEEEYYDKLQAAFDAREEAKQNGTLNNDKQDASTEEETIVNEFGVIEIKYPTIAPYQVDLFYFGGYDKYTELKDKGMLTRLDEELNSSSKELGKYIPATILANLKAINNGTYALPTNKAIGEYTYLLLNKEVLEKSYRNGNDFSDYTSLTCEKTQELLAYVANPDTGMNEDFYPLFTDLESTELLLSNLQFWGVDENGNLSDEFSVLGDYFKNSDNFKDPNTYAEIANLFENEQFLTDLEILKSYEFSGYYDGAEDKKFAVGYVKGGAELAEVYGDEYEMIPVACPRLSEDDLYSDMFGVCSYTSSTSRSMRILTMLNTDEEFRNLILYGIEGEHYQMVDTGLENEQGEPYKVVKRLNNEYVMDVNKTGNTLIAYPMEGELHTIREYAVKQNLDAKAELNLGFTPDYKGFEVNNESLQAVRTLSAEILAEYLACQNEEELEEFFVSAKERVAASTDVQLHIDADHGNEEGKDEEKECDGSCGSLQCSYLEWLDKMKIKK